MNVRERLEQQEYLLLAPWASHAAESRGRSVPDDPCDLRTVFQRDRDRIIHCKSFRRLKFKTQVFLSPEGDHYRTRLTHSGAQHPETPEGECVRRADRIAYLNHDLDDALRSGLIRLSDVPPDCLKVLGQTHRERINTMITDIVAASEGQPHLSMSLVVQEAMDGLREFMFQRVYRNPWRDPEEIRCDYVLRHLFEYYCAHPGEMPEEFVMIGYQDGIERSVCDYLSCMTDRYATRKFTALFAPSSFPAF